MSHSSIARAKYNVFLYHIQVYIYKLNCMFRKENNVNKKKTFTAHQTKLNSHQSHTTFEVHPSHQKK